MLFAKDIAMRHFLGVWFSFLVRLKSSAFCCTYKNLNHIFLAVHWLK